MNDARLKAMLKASQAGKYTLDRGLYFRISEEGNGFWMLRYSINNKRREFVFARYGRPPEGMTLAEARLESARLRSLVNQGIDPAAERKRAQLVALKPSMILLRTGWMNAVSDWRTLIFQSGYTAMMLLPTLVCSKLSMSNP
jgi:hypothetical protein